MVLGGGSVAVVKIVIASCLAPSAETGADPLGDQLAYQLLATGHEVEHLRLPFSDRDWRTIPAQMVAVRNFDIDSAERLIALDFPTYLLRHAHKVVWLAEHFLAGYDSSAAAELQAQTTHLVSKYRDLRSAADSEGLGEARSLFASSTAVGDRLRENLGISSTLLLRPTMNPEPPAPAGSWHDAIVRLLA